MTGTASGAEPIYSRLADDAELKRLVELFVQDMPERVSNLLARLEASDWEGVRRIAHQLKGAAGSYGFDPLTLSATRVEETVRQSRPAQEIRQSVEALVELCGRVQVRPSA